ncbi:glycosyl transferase [Paracoccus sp. Ld10]|uniref:glycosyl transferase n=1 Tax=Paracoccus sp. Ld10 TaxID=649158 RepID=UPI00386E7D62
MTYLAHDLDDPSIWRRVRMLRQGGAQVRIAGFRRGQGPLPEPATVLGHTANGRMIQRVRAIVAAWPRIARLIPPQDDGPEVILARNLEMLALGARLARARGGRLVYELLDIHGMMLGQGMPARILRRVEAGLMGRTSLVVLSSPAFQTRYLRHFGQPDVPILLVENKPFARPDMPPPQADPAPGGAEQGGPLIVGWFGMLRCRWSLGVLDSVTRAQPGRFRVILRGRPALDVMGDFHAVVDANPDLSFMGAYDWPDDLPDIYAQLDVAWLIDRYQAGQNSDWLLPNRLYEGCLNGAVPVVLDGTEVAHRVQAWGCGVTVAAPDAASVTAALSSIDPAGLAARRTTVANLPRAVLEMGEAECHDLTAAICGAGATASAAPYGVRDV